MSDMNAGQVTTRECCGPQGTELVLNAMAHVRRTNDQTLTSSAPFHTLFVCTLGVGDGFD